MEGDRIQSDPFTFVIFTTPVSLPVDHNLCTYTVYICNLYSTCQFACRPYSLYLHCLHWDWYVRTKTLFLKAFNMGDAVYMNDFTSELHLDLSNTFVSCTSSCPQGYHGQKCELLHKKSFGTASS